MVNARAKLEAIDRMKARGQRGEFTSVETMKNIAKSVGITDERIIRTLRRFRDLANKLAKK